MGATNGDIYNRPIAYNEFLKFSRQSALVNWQASWDKGELGRWLNSIIPKVPTKPWFRGLDVGRDFIRMMSRIMSNHYGLDAHLLRIGLASSNHCVCGLGYQDIEHVVWVCAEFRGARSLLLDTLRARGIQPYVPALDILAQRNLPYMLLVYSYLKSIKVPIKQRNDTRIKKAC